MKVLNQPFETTFRLQVRETVLFGLKILKSEDIVLWVIRKQRFRLQLNTFIRSRCLIFPLLH